jgi:hypothetical protein
MTNLQASTKDRSAATWAERKVMYKVGSYFKGCAHCGDTEEVETKSGGVALRFLTGHSVFRSYQPSAVKWTYWCWDCGAKDLQCWSDALDIGLDAIVGSRDSVKRRKMTLRKEAVKFTTKVETPSRVDEIVKLEAQIAELMAKLKR